MIRFERRPVVNKPFRCASQCMPYYFGAVNAAVGLRLSNVWRPYNYLNESKGLTNISIWRLENGSTKEAAKHLRFQIG